MRNQVSTIDNASEREAHDGERKATGSVGTLARGLDVLELFSAERSELSQKEISDELGLPVPTVHRLTRLMLERGYLERDECTRRLRLGLSVARLQPALHAGTRLPAIAREHLRSIADETGETVNLAVLHDGDVVYLLSESGSNLLTPRGAVGLRLPAHCTALGKCLLAQLPDAEAQQAAGPEPYAARTARTITGWAPLRDELERIRRRGVAYSHEEYETGLDSLAVAIPWTNGAPAAINVSLPTTRGRGARRTELTERLRTAASAIETAAELTA